MVGIESGQRDIVRIHGCLIEAPELAMGLGKVDLRVEWCSIGPLAPVGSVKRILYAEIEICLAADPQSGGWRTAIRREIAGPAEEVSDRIDALRQVAWAIPVAAVVVCADRCLEHPGHERRAGGRAHRSGADALGVTHALGRQAIQIRRAYKSVAVAPEVG